VNLTGVKVISAGLGHALALLEDGTVYAWGSNEYGQGGHGNLLVDYNTPLKVLEVQDAKNPSTKSLSGVTAIAAGAYHSLAVLKDGSVCAWGANDAGQLGDGTNTNQPTPVKVKDSKDATKNLAGIKAIAAGLKHSIACGDRPVA
jgi:alpha-tubulin suppressor-like RCC1 family protein